MEAKFFNNPIISDIFFHEKFNDDEVSRNILKQSLEMIKEVQKIIPEEEVSENKEITGNETIDDKRAEEI